MARYCKKGHEMTEENTYRNSRGVSQGCKKCKRLNARSVKVYAQRAARGFKWPDGVVKVPVPGWGST